jgi:alpha-L-fucosidase
MKVNGEAIYGTRPVAPYREGQMVFTQKGKFIYGIYLAQSENEGLPTKIVFKSLQSKAGSKVGMLGVTKPLKWAANPAGETVIEIPFAVVSTPPGKHAFVFRFVMK